MGILLDFNEDGSKAKAWSTNSDQHVTDFLTEDQFVDMAIEMELHNFVRNCAKHVHYGWQGHFTKERKRIPITRDHIDYNSEALKKKVMERLNKMDISINTED